MFRMGYSQGRVIAPEKAGVGQYPCSYFQRDPQDAAPGAATAPLNTYGIGVGCPSQRVGRTPVYAGERYLSGITCPPTYGEAVYGDYQTLHDGERGRTYAYLLRLEATGDTHFWYRGEDISSGLVWRKVNGKFDTISDETAIGEAHAMSSAGGTRFEALDVVQDPSHRDHALLLASEVDVAAWTAVASAEGDCDLSTEATYWQTSRPARLRAWESWDWETWTAIGTVWEGSVAAHPFMRWPFCEYPVGIEWLPSGILTAWVTYPTSWGTDKLKCLWPLSRHTHTPPYWTKGYEPAGLVHEFARVPAYQTTPWPFAAVTGWTAPGMAT